MEEPATPSLPSADVHVLLVEDDAFQRLALSDILSLCDYKVTVAENGRRALEILADPGAKFDLALVDVMMPEMDGMELLDALQASPQLRELPVLMMSTREEMSLVSRCLGRGAKDYLIKPIRLQTVRLLVKHVADPERRPRSPTKQLSKYQKVRTIGRGATGSVLLVKYAADGRLFALKQIALDQMSKSERKQAENEITLLKVLIGPTVVRYYDSFVERDQINILMEYAEGGSLNDKISQQRRRRQPFEEEQVMYWFAQIVLGVMLMHSKNILHRDLKCQNVFLNKECFVKLGDFGISKKLSANTFMAQTTCGTLYNMSPEVCQLQAYGVKSDMWALGCVLYEMLTLKKPFEHPTLAGVFQRICAADYDPLPATVSADVRLLVHTLFCRVPAKRPSVWQVARMPCIRRRIDRFARESGQGEWIRPLLETGGRSPTSFTPAIPPADIPPAAQPCLPVRTALEAASEEEHSGFDPGCLTDGDGEKLLTSVMRSSLPLKTRKVGFNKRVPAFTGAQLLDWIERYLGADRPHARMLFLALLGHGRLHPLDKYGGLDETRPYRFAEDLPAPYMSVLTACLCLCSPGKRRELRQDSEERLARPDLVAQGEPAVAALLGQPAPRAPRRAGSGDRAQQAGAGQAPIEPAPAAQANAVGQAGTGGNGHNGHGGSGGSGSADQLQPAAHAPAPAAAPVPAADGTGAMVKAAAADPQKAATEHLHGSASELTPGRATVRRRVVVQRA